MSATLAGLSASVDRSLEGLREIRAQARSVAERAKSSPVAERDAAVQSLISSIDSLESVVVQTGPQSPGPYDVLSKQPRLTTDLSGLQSAIEGTSGPVTSGEREQFGRLRTRSVSFIAGSDRVMSTMLARVNALLSASGLTTIARQSGGSPE